MDDLNDQIRQRMQKLEALRAAGIDPYGSRFPVKDTARELHRAHGEKAGETLEAEPVACTLAGRLMTVRSFGKATFAHIQDGTGRIQIYARRDRLGDEAYAFFKKLDLGDCIGVEGTLFKTRTGELTVDVSRVTLLAKALRPLPEKWHGLRDVEQRYRQRYLDLIVNPRVRDVFVLRTRIIQAIRGFLDRHGFLEVETPMMQPIPGGATARPFVTHHNALNMDLYLRIAPELYLKRLVVGGFERVYELNRNFRNEGISTRHNPEFTMLEFYMAYADYRDLMDFTEALIVHVAREVLGTLRIEYEGRTIDLTPPWTRQSLLEAIASRARVDAASLRDPEAARRLAADRGIALPEAASHGKVLNELFEHLVEASLVQPTFITDFPTDTSPLAKRRPDDPEFVERFELIVAGREIANAFSELNDPLDQRARFEQQLQERARGDEEAHAMDEDYLRALEYGLPPTAGCGIGIDRLVMLLTNASSIRDVILFPQMRRESP